MSIEDKVRKAIADVNQERSYFQIDHFVLGQHDTIEMAYYQCLLELDDLLSRRDIAELERKKVLIQIDRLRNSGDEIDAIDADIALVNLHRLESALSGTNREIEHLLAIWEQMPKFTRNEIEAGQSRYWELRLTRQAQIQAASEKIVSWSNIESLINARNTAVSSQPVVEIEK